MFILSALFFIMGASIASFLNVAASRLPKGESIVSPPSHCDACGHKLGVLDLIPVVSYLILGGKCRYCGEKFSPSHVIGEIFLGGIFVLYFHYYYFQPFLFIFLALSAVLYLLTVFDLQSCEMPDFLLWGVGIIGIIYDLCMMYILGSNWFSVIKYFGLSVLAGGGIFLLIFLLSRGGMGEGDVILIAALGLFVGIKEMFELIFLSFVLGAIISVALMALKVKSRKDAIPFGPFITLSFFIVQFFGERLLALYEGLF